MQLVSKSNRRYKIAEMEFADKTMVKIMMLVRNLKIRTVGMMAYFARSDLGGMLP
jgi:hypothetical protein